MYHVNVPIYISFSFVVYSVRQKMLLGPVILDLFSVQLLSALPNLKERSLNGAHNVKYPCPTRIGHMTQIKTC